MKLRRVRADNATFQGSCPDEARKSQVYDLGHSREPLIIFPSKALSFLVTLITVVCSDPANSHVQVICGRLRVIKMSDLGVTFHL